MTSKEQKYTFKQSQLISMQTGLIGYIRADMGTNGNEFWSTWNSFRVPLNTPEFISEKCEVITSFMNNGFLSNRNELAKFCRSDEVLAYDIGLSAGREFGYRVDTKEHSYLMRLNPYQGEYNLYCYCYKKDWLDSHLEKAERGIRFVNPDYREMFRINDGDKIRITYSDGEKADEICRYIDDYHVEVGNNLYHICEFAEKMEANGNTVVPLRSSLPEQCYIFVQTENIIGIVTKGEKGYIDSMVSDENPSISYDMVNNLNKKLGVTKAQVEAMKAGSILGWDCPEADPLKYTDSSCEASESK